MSRRSFLLLAMALAWCGRDGLWAQPFSPTVVHMSAGPSSFVDPRGVTWTPNICSGWVTFNNPGNFPLPIYNTPAYTAVAGVPITCTFTVAPGVYAVLVHLIEAVHSFNAPQKRVFDIWANGFPLLTGVDVFQRSGGVEFPYDVSGVINAIDQGVITLTFPQVKSSAMFAGIELIQVAPDYNIIDYETPVGAVDGVNTVFTVSKTPNPASSLHLFVNGLLQSLSSFSLSGSTITTTTPPDIGSTLIATYAYSNNLLPVAGVERWQCVGSGVSVDQNGTPILNPDGTPVRWDCAGFQLVKLTLRDGTTRGPYVGIVAGSQTAVNTNWVSVPVQAVDPTPPAN